MNKEEMIVKLRRQGYSRQYIAKMIKSELQAQENKNRDRIARKKINEKETKQSDTAKQITFEEGI